MGKLDQKVAIVTGGGTGIGQAIALTFAKEGADIVICGRTMDKLEKAAKEVEALGRHCLAIPADVSIKAQAQGMVEQAVARFGKIDILVNNAGVVRRASLLDMSEADWDTVMAINLKGVFLCTQAVAPYMIERKYGKIINISSSAGTGCLIPGLGGYSAAKAGVIQLTKAFAFEMSRYGINVNAIAPGVVITPITYFQRTTEQVEQYIENGKRVSVLGRVGSTQDIANLALFLASDESSFISGETIASDGGRLDRM
jgi:NAD(P)-dependent dehydrogenase (short-subunit alcohol dehydrogenase family)